MSEISRKLNIVLTKLELAYNKRAAEITSAKPYLVAVSKTKPVDQIIEAYNSGQRHFGENYIQELLEKSLNERIVADCQEIKWHFIGHLQTNKIKKLLQVKNLYMVQTVDSEKLAGNLNKALINAGLDQNPLRILVQVNTSREEAKNGVLPENALNLMQYIRENCKALQLQGLMTIGAEDPQRINGINCDFLELYKLYKASCETLKLPSTELDISMGMSNDYEEAIEQGSTIIRVGSFLFGERNYHN